MPHPTPEQDGPSEQGRTDRGADTVALTKDPAPPAGGPVAAPGPEEQDDRAASPSERAATRPERATAPQQGATAPSGWPPPTNTKAIIALCTALSVPVLAIVFGVMARREIDRTGEAGRAYATWGMALGIAITAFWALYAVVVLAFVGIAVLGAATAGAAYGGPGSGF